MSKIGIGIITCNRPEFLNKCVKSVMQCKYDEIIIVNDGRDKVTNDNLYIINNTTNLGVGKSKNVAMKYLLDKGCDYIFIIEDDMLIIDNNILQKYIEAHKKTGLHHFMFAYHGPANKGNISGGTPKPRVVVDYGDLKISLNQHCVGAFCFYTKECLTRVGLNDETYLNAFEHVDHSYLLAKHKYSTPYWWWADIANSLELINEQACSEQSSSIKPRSDWNQNIIKSATHFTKKHGMSPVQVPDTELNDVISFLKACKQKSQ